MAPPAALRRAFATLSFFPGRPTFVQRILIDVTRLLYRRVTRTLPTGIDRVSQAYVRRYGEGQRAVLSLGPFSAVMSEADSRALFRAVLDSAVPARLLALKVVAKAFGWRWLAGGGRDALLLNTGHIGFENPRYALLLRRRGVRVIAVVHDLIPITHPEFCRPREPARHRVRMRTAARVSSAIVANSRHTLDEFLDFCRMQGLRAPAATVARLGSGLQATPSETRPIAEPYFVILATIEPRKNHMLLLQLWRRMAAMPAAVVPRLLVIGQRGWECENVVDLLERCEPLRGIVLEKSGCSDTQLATWLHHAQALLFPSFAEGYGMPLAEALSMGVPVIASDLPAFREIAGAIPEYADPLDSPRWEALVAEYARPDSTQRAAQLARLAAFAPPSWEAHFAAVDELLAQGAAPGRAPVVGAASLPGRAP
jgi:glycosyltransferase involved in cell wall biosynthesis